MPEILNFLTVYRRRLFAVAAVVLTIALGLLGVAGGESAMAARSQRVQTLHAVSTSRASYQSTSIKRKPRSANGRRDRRRNKDRHPVKARRAGSRKSAETTVRVHKKPIAASPARSTGIDTNPKPASGTTATPPAGAGTATSTPVSTGSGAGTATSTPVSTGSGAGTTTTTSANGAVNTSNPTQVIGDGQPASCTSAAVVSAVAAGGIITFNCGPKPLTITMTATADVTKTGHLVVLDGGGLITLSGAGERQIMFSDTCQGTWSTDDCVNQPYPQVVVQNITFEDGYSDAQQNTSCTQNTPTCWYGGVDGGGAIYTEGGQFKAVNSNFVGNRCFADGPDLGGGAIRALAQYDNLPVYITHDTFTGNSCSNGGALSSINVGWNILSSQFANNTAIGKGANPAAVGTPGGGNGGAIYLDGKNDNTQITSTVMTGNTATEGGGAVFDVVDSGNGTLTFDGSQLANNTSGEFQTAPGVYDQVDGHDTAPVLIDSTDN